MKEMVSLPRRQDEEDRRMVMWDLEQAEDSIGGLVPDIRAKRIALKLIARARLVVLAGFLPEAKL